MSTSHSMLNLGLSVEKILAQLEDTFPPYLPHPHDPDRMVMYKSGQRSVIEYIKQLINEEELSDG